MQIESNNVTFYEKKEPIFSLYRTEQQILDLYKEHVKLRSGGHLNINTTEALTAIDVNSGKMNKEIGIKKELKKKKSEYF